MSECYIVLGLARSGTSLTAGILQRLGVNMDATLGSADWYAPKGYCESYSANAINKTLFQLAWEGKKEIPNDDVNYYWNPPEQTDLDRVAQVVKPEIEHFCQKHHSEHKWGFKNPATCLTLQYYLPYIDHVRILFVQRDIDENVQVCSDIYGIEKCIVRSILEGYINQASSTCETHQLPILHVSYNDLKTNHQKVAHSIAKFCRIRYTQSLQDKVDEFVVKQQFGAEKYRNCETIGKQKIMEPNQH